MNTQDLQSSAIRISENATFEWIDDHRIVVFTTLQTPTRHDIDAWMKKVLEILNDLEEGGSYLALYDLRYSFLSPYARQQSQHLIELAKRKKVTGYFASVVGNNVFGQVMTFFVNFTLSRIGDKTSVGMCFTSREEALAWLREKF
ncbi:MAG: hypothetical protein SFZ02_18525 [bacterium]|nr:hypothetical protein [bacterium]